MRENYTPKARFTQEQYDKARSVPLLPFLEQRGYDFKKCGSEYHMKLHDSFVVKNDLWRWYSQGLSGNVISFLTKVENMNIVSAVLHLCGEENSNLISQYKPITRKKQNENKNLLLPQKNDSSRHIFAYLMKIRGIDRDIISKLIHEGKLFEGVSYFANIKTENNEMKSAKLIDFTTLKQLKDINLVETETEDEEGLILGYDGGELKYIAMETLNDEYLRGYINSGKIEKIIPMYNCVFCGFDETGSVKYASMRGTKEHSKFRQDAIGSDKHYGFTMEGTNDELYVFEAPIDALSHATLYKLIGEDWETDNRISLGGISDLALEQYLTTHPDIKNITFCLDNDRAGKTNIYGIFDEIKGDYTTKSLLEKYKDMGYAVYASFPATKDYNTDLTTYLTEISDEESIQSDKDDEDEL